MPFWVATVSAPTGPYHVMSVRRNLLHVQCSAIHCIAGLHLMSSERYSIIIRFWERFFQFSIVGYRLAFPPLIHCRRGQIVWRGGGERCLRAFAVSRRALSSSSHRPLPSHRPSFCTHTIHVARPPSYPRSSHHPAGSPSSHPREARIFLSKSRGGIFWFAFVIPAASLLVGMPLLSVPSVLAISGTSLFTSISVS